MVSSDGVKIFMQLQNALY